LIECAYSDDTIVEVCCLRRVWHNVAGQNAGIVLDSDALRVEISAMSILRLPIFCCLPFAICLSCRIGARARVGAPVRIAALTEFAEIR